MSESKSNPAKTEQETRNFIRSEMLRRCPDLAAHLFELEQLAEPYYGINEQPYLEDEEEGDDV